MFTYREYTIKTYLNGLISLKYDVQRDIFFAKYEERRFKKMPPLPIEIHTIQGPVIRQYSIPRTQTGLNTKLLTCILP